MKMLNLLLFNLRHLFRARVVWTLLIFSITIQYLILGLMSRVTVTSFGTEAIRATVTGGDFLYAAIIIQVFVGFLTSAIYGIWMAPYLHQGYRAPLTHVLPVPRVLFPLSYATSLLFLLFLQTLTGLVMLATLRTGSWEAFEMGQVGKSILCVLYQYLSFSVLMLGFASIALILRAIPTFFAGMVFAFISQITATAERMGKQALDLFADHGALFAMRTLWKYLPPLGNLIFDLKEINGEGTIPQWHIALWLIWGAVFLLLFQYKLRYPALTRSSEN